MKNKIILTDCDGVCLDWEAGFTEWMKIQGYKVVESGVYDISVMYGIEKAEGKRLIREFNNSAWMGSLSALRDSRSGMAKLVEAGYRFLAITSLSLDAKAKTLRVRNLERLYGDVFVDVICLDTGADKDEALEPYRDSEMYWIEDKWSNAVLGAELGLKSILIDHPHNAAYSDERIVRASTWANVVEEILG